jgi:hypothetical protein
MGGATDVVAQIVSDRGALTITVALCAWVLKRVLDATLPRGYHFRGIERWLRPTRRNEHEKDQDGEDEVR